MSPVHTLACLTQQPPRLRAVRCLLCGSLTYQGWVTSRGIKGGSAPLASSYRGPDNVAGPLLGQLNPAAAVVYHAYKWTGKPEPYTTLDHARHMDPPATLTRRASSENRFFGRPSRRCDNASSSNLTAIP